MKKNHVQIRLHCQVLEILTENGIASGVKLKIILYTPLIL